MDTTYAAIKPLVAASQDTRTHVVVTFRCPATGLEVQSEAPWPDDGLLETTAKQAKRGLFGSIRNAISCTVVEAAGGGAVGSIAGSAGQSVIYGAGQDLGSGKAHSNGDREAATAAAFNRVADRFRWDEAGHRFVASSAAQVEGSPFRDHLTGHPVTEAYDRDVLARLLGALIASDSSVGDAERADFAAMVPGASLDELTSRRAPTAVDFEETQLGPTRETILLVAWAIALSDEHLAEPERELLDTTATGLGLTPERAAEIRDMAHRHIIDEAIATLAAAGTSADAIRAQVESLGDQIGLGADEAARVVIRWQKARTTV